MRLLQTYPHVMDLKDYQRRVLEELGEYAGNVAQFRGIGAIPNPAEVAFVSRTNQPWKPLSRNPNTPFVCLKVPTGGGKTLIAANAAGLLYDALLQDKDDTGIILWLTPSDTIRSQTLRALKDPDHPYRKVLESGFGRTIHVLDKGEALRMRPDQVRDGVAVIVSTMQAMKREDKEGLKAYQDNGYLQPHFSEEDEREGVTFSLFEVIRRDRPLIIADEGHNAKTVLALDLIESLDPSFVLELTATPADQSNVLSAVSALELKEEQMVKLPINLTNETHWEAALRGAVLKRDELEGVARREREETGEYIRPMLLVQAEQEKENPDKVHVVRDMIVGYAGCLDSGVRFLGWVKRGMGSRGNPNDLSDQFTGLVLDEDGIYEYRFQLVPIRVEGDCWAIGTGAQAALGAMFMGADPQEAAEVACAIDPFCGGPVTVERL